MNSNAPVKWHKEHTKSLQPLASLDPQYCAGSYWAINIQWPRVLAHTYRSICVNNLNPHQACIRLVTQRSKHHQKHGQHYSNHRHPLSPRTFVNAPMGPFIAFNVTPHGYTSNGLHEVLPDDCLDSNLVNNKTLEQYLCASLPQSLRTTCVLSCFYIVSWVT